ncbi:MAG: CDP-alcohol phosphatidyltransferase family protein [Myxococcales bacterium]|nr:CDP-alcohol phosphatidyltransferase family protein [Myxococcales bacterium]
MSNRMSNPMSSSSAARSTSAPPATAPRLVSPYNPANAVTASRFLTLPPFLWAVHHGHYQIAAVAIVVCALLDKVDGLVAKVFDCRSSFGELFDAITDGVCYGFCLIVLAVYGWAPAVAVVAALGLGGLNSVFRAIHIKRVGRPVNYKSYAMERLVGFIAYLVGFAVARYEVTYYYWTFLPLMVVVVAHDAKRMLLDPVPPPPAADGATSTSELVAKEGV